jgi:acyl-CoA synthetase (AMP-forming)/AMP-acid ligase II
MNGAVDLLGHLDVVYNQHRSGPVVADDRIRLDIDSFRACVAGAAARFSAFGVGHGDVIATVLANRVELVVAMFAAWDLGATLTPVNPALTADEIAYQLGDGRACLAVVQAETADKVDVASIDASVLLESGDPGSLRGGATADDLALLVYTSGTTGRPKGVMLDHGNLGAMTAMLLEQNAFTPTGKSLLVLPLFHVNAIMVSIVTPLAVGGSAFIARRFDADSFWTLVEQERPAFFSAVPAIYRLLSALPDHVRPVVPSVRFAVCGAAPMSAGSITAFEERYGIPILEGYGLSESTVALTATPMDDRRPGTVGRPMRGIDLRIIDENGDPVPVGHDGEVIARGPNIMRGYLNKPTETAVALRNGWLHTGDVGHIDSAGFLVLVDRMKDLIIRGGENISPSEVEAVLEAHPSVSQAAVVGRPDPIMGEEPVAFVVAAHGHHVDPTRLLAYSSALLARFKVPRSIYEVDELPRNAVGKVTKDVLRRQLTERS